MILSCASSLVMKNLIYNDFKTIHLSIKLYTYKIQYSGLNTTFQLIVYMLIIHKK